ncbi:predicted protein [Nematostella vectensis]|uniref:VWFA domain-containing protein n=1 Tax=Nematostella vectensis TaxID=45351 RepID=A7SV32_NEMVE|nr:predicted protein [Nematostella vectensis]|eukprot:XP_001624545.1 predicted protein [Nematostella vectensis]
MNDDYDDQPDIRQRRRRDLNETDTGKNFARNESREETPMTRAAIIRRREGQEREGGKFTVLKITIKNHNEDTGTAKPSSRSSHDKDEISEKSNPSDKSDVEVARKNKHMPEALYKISETISGMNDSITLKEPLKAKDGDGRNKEEQELKDRMENEKREDTIRKQHRLQWEKKARAEEIAKEQEEKLKDDIRKSKEYNKEKIREMQNELFKHNEKQERLKGVSSQEDIERIAELTDGSNTPAKEDNQLKEFIKLNKNIPFMPENTRNLSLIFDSYIQGKISSALSSFKKPQTKTKSAEQVFGRIPDNRDKQENISSSDLDSQIESISAKALQDPFSPEALRDIKDENSTQALSEDPNQYSINRLSERVQASMPNTQVPGTFEKFPLKELSSGSQDIVANPSDLKVYTIPPLVQESKTAHFAQSKESKEGKRNGSRFSAEASSISSTPNPGMLEMGRVVGKINDAAGKVSGSQHESLLHKGSELETVANSTGNNPEAIYSKPRDVEKASETLSEDALSSYVKSYLNRKIESITDAILSEKLKSFGPPTLKENNVVVPGLIPSQTLPKSESSGIYDTSREDARRLVNHGPQQTSITSNIQSSGLGFRASNQASVLTGASQPGEGTSRLALTPTGPALMSPSMRDSSASKIAYTSAGQSSSWGQDEAKPSKVVSPINNVKIISGAIPNKPDDDANIKNRPNSELGTFMKAGHGNSGFHGDVHVFSDALPEGVVSTQENGIGVESAPGTIEAVGTSQEPKGKFAHGLHATATKRNCMHRNPKEGGEGGMGGNVGGMGGGNGGGMGGGNGGSMGGSMGGGNGGSMGGGNGGGMGGGNVGGMGGGNGGGMGGGEGGGQVGGGGMGGGMGGGGSVGGNIGGGIGGGGGMGGGGTIGGGTSGGMVGGGQGGGTNGGAGMHVCLDLGFLIDGSMSVGGEMNFKQIINFVWNVVQSFQVSAHFTRVGLAIFSLEAFVIFNFHTYYDKNNILDALNNVQYPGTDGPGTYIGRGLHVAKEYLFEASGRPRVPHALIVVAAGRSLDDVITPSLSLRRMGVDIYTVGVGKFYTKLQMHAMASFPHSEHVFGAWYPQLGFYAQNVVTKILKGISVHFCHPCFEGHHDLCDFCPEEFHSEAFRRHHGISGNSTKTPPPQGQNDDDAPISLASGSTQKDYTKDEFNDEYKGPDVFDLEPKLQPFSNMERNSTLDDDSFHDDALSSNDDVVGYHDNIDDDPSDSHRRHHKKAKNLKMHVLSNYRQNLNVAEPREDQRLTLTRMLRLST